LVQLCEIIYNLLLVGCVCAFALSVPTTYEGIKPLEHTLGIQQFTGRKILKASLS
jgi:hypothetical protein